MTDKVGALFLSGLTSLLLLLLAPGCASSPKSVAPPGAEQRVTLFPNGTYRNNVRVLLKNAVVNGKKEMRFNGVLDLREETIRIVSVSPFGTTVFRLIEDRKTGDVKLETSVDSLKKAESQIKNYYVPIRTALTLPLSQLSSSRELRVDGYHIQYFDFDSSGIPLKTLIQSDAFDISVGIDSYAP